MSLILVVDDHPVTREPLARVLRHEGFDTRCAANGLEALAELENATPDLVLLDVMMPKMTGLSFLETARRDPRWGALPVIVLTGSHDPNQIAGLKDLGVWDVMVKARFTVEQLLERVQACLANEGKTKH